MREPFDMELFLAGIMSGANATKKRHVHQAAIIQQEINKHWKECNPWRWKKKHLTWFINEKLKNHSNYTRYHYGLTMKLIIKRLERNWRFKLKTISPSNTQKNPAS